MLTDIMTLADYPNPHATVFTVTDTDIDGYGHVNNAVYLHWLNDAVWQHSTSMGVSEKTCAELNRGMAVVHHDIDYLMSAYAGDKVVVFNWLTANDQKLRASRIFQLVRISDQKTLLRARTDYICTNLKTGRPTRMPEIFKTAYADTYSPDSDH